MFVLLAGLVIFSTFVNAPLRELANPNLTPNPSKAPWYFLGLQELLRYFHPMVAGITIPTFILVGLAAVPYVDRNPSTKPGDRKIAITMFTMLFMFGATLTIIGSLLPRSRLQLGLAVGAGGVLRAMSVARRSPAARSRRHRRARRARPVRDRVRPVVPARAQGAARAPPTPRRPARAAPAASRRPGRLAPRVLPQVAARPRSLVFGAQFGGATIAFLWPNLKGGFGSVINAGNIADIKARDRATRTTVYNGAGRFYIVPYNGRPTGDVDYGPRASPREGIMPLYQRCVHLGMPRAVLRAVEVVRVPLPRLEVQQRRRVPARPGARAAWTGSTITVDGGGNVMVDTSEVDPRAAARDRHDRRAAAGRLLRGAGLGETEDAAMLALSTAPGIALADRRGACSPRSRSASCSCAAATRETRPRHPARRCGPGPPTPRSRRRCCRSCRAGASCCVAFFVVWIPVDVADRALHEPRARSRTLLDAVDRARRSARSLLFSEENQLGVGCVRCHGPELTRRRHPGRRRASRIPPDLTTVCGGPNTGHTRRSRRSTTSTTAIEQGRGRRCRRGASGTRARSTTSRSTTSSNYLIELSSENVPFEDNMCLNQDAARRRAAREAPGATGNRVRERHQLMDAPRPASGSTSTAASCSRARASTVMAFILFVGSVTCCWPPSSAGGWATSC